MWLNPRSNLLVLPEHCDVSQGFYLGAILIKLLDAILRNLASVVHFIVHVVLLDEILQQRQFGYQMPLVVSSRVSHDGVNLNSVIHQRIIRDFCQSIERVVFESEVLCAELCHETLDDRIHMHSKFFLVLLGIKLFKVAVMVLHHAQEQVNCIHIDLMITFPATFINHGEKSHKYLLPLLLLD